MLVMRHLAKIVCEILCELSKYLTQVVILYCAWGLLLLRYSVLCHTLQICEIFCVVFVVAVEAALLVLHFGETVWKIC